MAVNTTNRSINHDGRGTTGPYAFPYKYDDTDDLLVTTRDGDYNEQDLKIGDGISSITAAGVTTSEAVPSDGQIWIRRWTNPLQLGSSCVPATIEARLDTLTMAVQDALGEIYLLKRLAIQFPYFSPHRDFRISRTLVDRGFLRLDASQTGLEFVEIEELSLNEDAIQAMIDTETAALATDFANALTGLVWHDAAGWTRNSANDATDTDYVQLANVLIPAMGTNDALEIITSWTFVGADTKQVRVVFGCDADGDMSVTGAVFCDPPLTTQLNANTHTVISNRGAVDSQYGYNASVTTVFAVHTSATGVTSAIDTSQPQYLSFQCAWDAAANAHSCRLERYLVRWIRP